jgi:hypothetical protein
MEPACTGWYKVSVGHCLPLFTLVCMLLQRPLRWRSKKHVTGGWPLPLEAITMLAQRVGWEAELAAAKPRRHREHYIEERLQRSCRHTSLGSLGVARTVTPRAAKAQGSGAMRKFARGSRGWR